MPIRPSARSAERVFADSNTDVACWIVVRLRHHDCPIESEGSGSRLGLQGGARRGKSTSISRVPRALAHPVTSSCGATAAAFAGSCRIRSSAIFPLAWPSLK